MEVRILLEDIIGILDFSDFIKIGYILLLKLIDYVFYMCSTVNFFGEHMYKSEKHKKRYIFFLNISTFTMLIYYVPIMIKIFTGIIKITNNLSV